MPANTIIQLQGSEISPLNRDITLFANTDQIVRMTIRPIVQGGIAGQNFALEFRVNYDDPAATLAVSGTINDAANCMVDFPISAAQAVALLGRYVYNVRRTDAGNASPLSFGQAKIIQAA
jgi:hypothetical protein